MADDDWATAIDDQEGTLSTQVQSINITSNGTNSAVPAARNIPPPIPTPEMSAPVYTLPSAVVAPAGAGDGWGDEEGDIVTEKTAAESSLLRKAIRNKLVTPKADLDVLQRDPNSPLFSVKSFEALNLKPELLKGVYDMGFNSPSKIQETALPALLADPPVNMIAQSQSGTGKTAAFVLTMLSRVDPSQKHTQCLCVAPTFELARQIGEVTQRMSKYIQDLSIGFAVRGERVERGVPVEHQILIGTPGTVLDWSMKSKAVDLKKVNVFVLDEADVMIATQGHKDQSVRIQRQLRKDCQMLLFSATYDEEVMNFAPVVVPDAIVISLRREEQSLDNIKQYYISCGSKGDKLQALADIYGTITIGQSMIFCQTRKTASWLSEEMTKQGHAVALLSGDLVVEQRAAIINRFREGKEKVLITTNVSSRGIDIEQVTIVVNFDMPEGIDHKADCETYLHRIGRTGRFGKQGLAINFVDGDNSPFLKTIEEHFGRKICRLDAKDVEQIEKIGN